MHFGGTPWKPRCGITAVLFSRPAGLLAGVFVTLIILGCMSISFGGRHYASTDGTIVQEGEVRLSPGAEQVIYYPAPYASIPNLELTSEADYMQIVEQHEDRFRVRNTDRHFRRKAQWKARGVRTHPLPVPAAGTQTPQTPPLVIPAGTDAASNATPSLGSPVSMEEKK
jgi:hypothetical protein